MSWDDILFDGARPQQHMTKSAGLFMRPSDIADHTELAGALEARLNGTTAHARFKNEPRGVNAPLQKTASAFGSDPAARAVTLYAMQKLAAMNSQHVDAIAGAGTALALNLASRKRLRAMISEPPQEIEGGRVRRTLAKARRRAAEAHVNNPVTSAAVSALAGGAAGYRSGLNLPRQYAKLTRQAP